MNLNNTNNLLKLNLGCGARLLDGYLNIDNASNVILSKIPLLKSLLIKVGIIPKIMDQNDLSSVKFMQLPNGLKKFKESSADRIYSCHLIEHLMKNDAIFMLNECYRILCKGGLLRLVAPDTRIFVKNYLKDTEDSLKNKNYTSKIRDDLFDILVGAFHDKKFLVRGRGKNHLFFWDVPSIYDTLQKIGFSNIRICSFKESIDMEMASIDNHEEFSFYIEAIK